MPGTKSDRPILRRYAKWAPRYDRRWVRYTDATLAKAQSLIERHAPQPTSLADVACGTGTFARRLRRRWPELRIVGLDFSPHMLRQAREAMPDDRHVDWVRGSAEHLPLDDAAFDVVTCNNAFHLVRDQDAALAEFQRVLRPGGLLVIIDWNRDAPSIKLINLNYEVFGRHPRHITTTEELSEAVQSSGFEVIEEGRFAATWFWRLSAVAARKPRDG